VPYRHVLAPTACSVEKGVIAVSQQGQLIRLKSRARDGEPLWAYRYRTGGRNSERVQRGGFTSERDAAEALQRELERLRRQRRVAGSLTLAELVDAYLAQHDVEPVTIEKLRWLLARSSGSTTPHRGAGSSARSSPGQNSMRSPRISLPATGRW
jgi:hypothetical protein